MSEYDVVCAIPRSGRTFENFIHKLQTLHAPRQQLQALIDAVKQGKANSSRSIPQVTAFLNQQMTSSPYIGVFIDRKRANRPYRIGFLGIDIELNGFTLRLEGDEPHNCSSLVSLGEADIALAGLDELLTVMQSNLNSPENVTKWGMYNYHLPKEKKVRIAGSALLTRWNQLLKRPIQDMVGFFLIAKHKPELNMDYSYPKDYLQHLESHRDKIYVKGRYADMIRSAYPFLNIMPVHDVEDAVVASQSGSVGLEIVQTGSTLKRKGLIILGQPLFLSESVYVVDYYKYLNNPKLRLFLDKIQPVGYFDSKRLRQFALWFYALEQNIGDYWINKPDMMELFCGEQDSEHGLRPTRLQTRYWMPSDSYKTLEAYDLVEQAKQNLRNYYQELVCSSGNSHSNIS